MSIEDSRAIGDGLKDNHTLIGLHFENGNEGSMDQMGFVKALDLNEVIEDDGKGIQ
jgi:hypothetical protein